ncbi:MAG: hypothetical protein KUG62_11340 [Rhodobacteraceae bacterium]|nr:hypothetical protein [Paracoccaceae bacterium]
MMIFNGIKRVDAGVLRSGRRLFRARQSHHQGKGENQETDNPATPLAASKTSRLINHTTEPEPPKLKPL